MSQRKLLIWNTLGCAVAEVAAVIRFPIWVVKGAVGLHA